MKAEQINPFVVSAQSILEQVAQIKVSRGKLSLRPKMFPSRDVSVILGVTGDVKGQVIYGMDTSTAMDLTKRMMMGLEVDDFDDVARSAIAELGNMITGNATSLMEKEGITTNISPPAIVMGKDVSVSSPEGRILVVPLDSDVGIIEINVCLLQKQ